MADVVANYRVEIQKLRMQIANQTATVERQRFEIFEMEDRIDRAKTNIGVRCERVCDPWSIFITRK